MSTEAMTQAELDKRLAEIDNLNAETRKMVAEMGKVQVETKKIMRETFWYPMITGMGLATALISAGAAAAVAVVKFLS